MKANIYLIVINLFISFSLIAQNNDYHLKYKSCTNCNTNPVYGEATEFETINITSDFGRRRGGSISKWHKGVDYAASNNVGDQILSLNNCSIVEIQGTEGYKFVLTNGDAGNNNHHFGYGHLFTSDIVPSDGMKEGNMVLKKMDDYDFFAIINVEDGMLLLK